MKTLMKTALALAAICSAFSLGGCSDVEGLAGAIKAYEGACKGNMKAEVFYTTWNSGFTLICDDFDASK